MIEEYVRLEDCKRVRLSLQEKLDMLKEAAKELVEAVEEDRQGRFVGSWRSSKAINQLRELLGMECWT